LTKLKIAVEQGEKLDFGDLDDKAATLEAGQFLNSCRKLKAHPDRLHEELW